MCKSAEYYRKNKENRKVVHQCPHCDYSTTGPKIALKHHILAKHTPENERPFQCPHEGCCRGFAQKIHLQKHLCKVHNEKKQVGRKKTVLYYIVNRTLSEDFLSPDPFSPTVLSPNVRHLEPMLKCLE